MSVSPVTALSVAGLLIGGTTLSAGPLKVRMESAQNSPLFETKKPFWRWAALSFLALLLAGGVALYWWLFGDIPPLHTIETRMVLPTTQILDRNGQLLYEIIDPNAGKQINLSLDSLPQTCIQATIATEDSRFYQHPGVDPIAIVRATWQNMQAGGDIVSGASTLTQQLARTLLLEPHERYDQSLRRKLREAWIALRLELRYTKNELLALYLNQTYYGNFAFGIEAAAQIFFAKPAAQLSRAECALLAGLIQYPSGYNPLQDPNVAKQRQLTVLRLMHDAGYLTEEERTAIAAEPLRYRSQLFSIQAPHFVIYVQDLLARRFGTEQFSDLLRQGGLRIYTTLDLNLQRQAEAAVRYRLDLLNCRKPGLCDNHTDRNRRVDNAAAVILDSTTGEILAMVGSPNYFDSSIQGNVNATLVLRQPGSAIKPLTYAAALDPTWSKANHFPLLTPASIIADLPTTFYVSDEEGGNVPYTPVNYDRTFHGPVSVRTALANSYNIPAVKVLEQIGVPTLQSLATRAGISTFTHKYGLALTLGGGEVKLLELTAAYGIFQAGQRLDPQAILRIEDLDTKTIDRVYQPPADRPTAARQVIDPATAYLVTDILSDNIARIPAFGEGSVLELPFPAAVKTGTTTDWRDNWTIGYTTERVIGVWVGNADNTPMFDVSGIDGAGPIWHDLMLAAHPRQPAPFRRPEAITEVTICAPSGLLPTPACPRTRRERFIVGTAPTELDNQFQEVEIDVATGEIASETTPAARRSKRVFWHLSAEYHDWMIAQGIPIMDCQASGACQSLSENSSEPQLTQQPASHLILRSPTSHTAYQIHPGLPQSHQRIEIAGYVANGQPWAELALQKDGVVLTRATNTNRLQSWWTLEIGTHQFELVGRPTADSDLIRSPAALVVVDDYQQPQTASAAPAIE